MRSTTFAGSASGETRRQFLAAAIPPAFGVRIDHFTLPFIGVVDLPAWLGVPLSMLFIVAA